MNIVFWGEEHDSGTTAHMLAVADMLAVLCPKTEIVRSYVPQEAGAATAQNHAPQRAGTALMRNHVPQEVGTAFARKQASQEVGTALARKIPQETGDAIHIYDCGTELGRRRRHMLWHADLVVVNLRQERACLEHFFQENFHIAKDMVFLLDARDCEVGVNRAYLEQIYRVGPEEIGVLPHNNEFYQALLRGRGDAFIRQTYRLPENEENERFVRELRKIALLILRKAEETQILKAKEEEERRQKKLKRGRRKRC